MWPSRDPRVRRVPTDGTLGLRVPNDFYVGHRKAGRIALKRSKAADILVVHLNCTTDLAKAPAAIASVACNLVDFIDTSRLRISRPAALGPALLQKLMTTLPSEVER